MNDIRKVQTNHFLCWTDGIRIDGGTLVFASFFGPRNAVRAIWAHLVAKRSSEIKVEGFSDSIRAEARYTTIQTPMGNGGLHLCIINTEATNQLSAFTKNFYHIGDFSWGDFSSYWGKLTRLCPVPMRPSWKDSIWDIGRIHNLIEPLGGFGIPAFRITADETWFPVVMSSINEGRLA